MGPAKVPDKGPMKPRGQRVGVVAALLAGSLLLARVIGYFREVVLAYQLGASAETDAFYAAFLLPDVLNYLAAGGALTVAFLPLFTRTREQRGPEVADRLFAIVLGTLSVAVTGAVVVLWLGADRLVARLFPDFAPETLELTIELTRILLPAQVAFVAGGVLRARLMADNRFSAQALAGLVYGLASIAGGLSVATPQGFAWGALVGAWLGHALLPGVELWRSGKLRIGFAPLSDPFRQYFLLALPLMIGVSLVTLDEWYDKLLGASLATGSIALLGYARKLMQLPVTILGQSVAVAVLPAMSRLRGEERQAELNAMIERVLSAVVGLSVICAAFTVVFAKHIVTVVYQRGAFGTDDIAPTAAILAAFAIGIPAWTVQPVAVRAFYVREEMWRPMLLGTAVALASLPLYFLLRGLAGATGLALSGAIAMTVNAVATLVWARIRFGGPALPRLGEAALRGFAVGLPAVGLAWLGVEQGLSDVGSLYQLAAALAMFGAIAVPGWFWLGDEGSRAALLRVAGRLRWGRGTR